MSNPENPLSQYHTYSYHHILLVCSTTVAAEAIQKSNSLMTFMRSKQKPKPNNKQGTNQVDENTPEDPYAKYRAIPVRDKNNGKLLGNYCIIINGMTDSDFVISKTKWLNITAADSGSNAGERFTTMTAEGSMTIQEPRGIKFLNVMAEIANELKSDPSGLIFVLKTIFIGHVADSVAFGIDDAGKVHQSVRKKNQTFATYDPITNIRPLLFMMYDITAAFDVTGGTYEISFVGLNNGASKQKHIMRAAEQISINFSEQESRTLGAGLRKLQTEINKQYDDYYNEVKRRVELTVDSKGNMTKFKGKKVKYIIEAEWPYIVNGRPNTDYVITDFKQQNTDKGKKDEGGIISFGTSKSIEGAIMMIVNKCQRVKDDAEGVEDKERGEDTKYLPKVVSTIESDNNEFRVIYKLRRVMEPRQGIIERVLKRKSDRKDKQDKDIRNNTFELDYFFTGLNTDIITFDIKMEMGLAFFQTLVTCDTLPSTQDAVAGKVPASQHAQDESLSRKATGKKEAKEKDNTPLQNVRENTPIYFSTKFNPVMTRNTKDAKKTAAFQQMLNRHAALENLEAKITIHGNSGLLNAVNKSPSEVRNHVTPDQTEANPDEDTLPYWETTPALVKLNIKMPSSSENNESDFSEVFWYEGFYYCFGITHMFSDGLFTQELDMISLPQSEPLKKKKTKSKKESKQEEKQEENKTAATSSSSESTGTQGAGAGAAGSGSSYAETQIKKSTVIDNETKTPAEVVPEKAKVSDYVKAFFKDQQTPRYPL